MWRQGHSIGDKSMKRIFILFAVLACFAVPAARAQDHAEVGAFVDFFRLHETGTNLVGLGARVSINARKHLQLEAEMGYDFNRAFTEGFKNTSTGTVTL